MAAKAALKTTTTTPPAKAPRTRKPKLVDNRPDAEEIAISKLPPVASPPLTVEDFALVETATIKSITDRLAYMNDESALPMIEKDYALDDNCADGSVFTIVGSQAVIDMIDRFLPDEDVRSAAAAASEKVTNLQAITIADLERALKSAEGQGEALAGSVNDLLGKLTEARTENGELTAKISADGKTIKSLTDQVEEMARFSDLRGQNLSSLRQENQGNRDMVIAKEEELRLLKGKVANDRWHEGRLQAELIRRKRLTFWQRVRQVFRPDDFNGSNVDQALHRIRLDMVDQAEADALRGIQSGEGDLGALAHKRIKARGAV